MFLIIIITIIFILPRLFISLPYSHTFCWLSFLFAGWHWKGLMRGSCTTSHQTGTGCRMPVYDVIILCLFTNVQIYVIFQFQYPKIFNLKKNLNFKKKLTKIFWRTFTLCLCYLIRCGRTPRYKSSTPSAPVPGVWLQWQATISSTTMS